MILVHLARQEILIGGTEYAGEIKKGAFGIMNYRLPDEGVLPMHSSVNVGRGRRRRRSSSASRARARRRSRADPERTLIGDDEHGWSDDGVFNFEGGCYAKTIRLSPHLRAGHLLHHAPLRHDPRERRHRPATRELDLDSDGFTENTRAAFPLHFIGNSSDRPAWPATRERRLPDRRCVRRAAARSARLTRDQAMYHFISGYTAKLAGTEVGVKEPTATFSTCFGAPFMPRHPCVYAAMLGERLDQLRRAGLAGQHRLDGRPVRRRASA